jgi:hypothetical protein
MDCAFHTYKRKQHHSTENQSQFLQSDQPMGTLIEKFTTQSVDINKNSVQYLIEPVESNIVVDTFAPKTIVSPFLTWPERIGSEGSRFKKGHCADLYLRVFTHEHFKIAQSLSAPTIPFVPISVQASRALQNSDLKAAGFNAMRGSTAIGKTERQVSPEHRDSASLLPRLANERLAITSSNDLSTDRHIQPGQRSRKNRIHPKRQWGLADWSPMLAEERLEWRRKQVREALRRHRERIRTKRADIQSLDD